MKYHLFSAPREIPEAEKPAGRFTAACVMVRNSNSLDPTGKPLTVEAWVKTNAGNGTILSRGAGVNGYALIIRNNKPVFLIRSSRKLYSVRAKGKLRKGWNHVVGVLSRDKVLKVYLNGKISGKKRIPVFIARMPVQPMEIGADLNGAVGKYRVPFALKGSIDEVRVYHRELSEEEILDHFENPGFVGQEEEGPVLAFSFESGKAKDLSGNGNHGRIRGAKPVKGISGRALRFIGGGGWNVPVWVKYNWRGTVPLHVRAMAATREKLFIAGFPALVDEEKAFDTYGTEETQLKLLAERDSYEGKKGGILVVLSKKDGKGLSSYKLEFPPRWDGMACANGKIYISNIKGTLLCLKAKSRGL